MKTIVCSVMEGKFVKEYELTYDEQQLSGFFEKLKNTSILPTKSEEDMVRVHNQIWGAERFDRINTLRTQDDVKSYIQNLHESEIMDLTELYVLMKSNGEMRTNEVRNLFKEFLDLYTYREISSYDMYYLPQIIRAMYEMGAPEEVPKYDSEMVRVNTAALKEIGFSIENKLAMQNNEEQPKQKVIK